MPDEKIKNPQKFKIWKKKNNKLKKKIKLKKSVKKSKKSLFMFISSFLNLALKKTIKNKKENTIKFVIPETILK